MKTVVEEYVAHPAQMRLFQQERAIYEVTELIESLLKEAGISRAEFAKRLGKTKGWVTQLLDGDSNKTIRTVADACAVLGHEFRVSSQPIQISNATAHTTIATVTNEIAVVGSMHATRSETRSETRSVERALAIG
jgi:transcriptional regulator with XRE-family HTH domain